MIRPALVIVLLALLTWAAIILLIAVTTSCAAPGWLVNRQCTPLYDLPHPVEVETCSAIDVPYAICTIRYADGDDIRCRSQLERKTCDGEWEEVAHVCHIYGEPDEQCP